MKEFLFLVVFFFAPLLICVAQIPSFQFTHKGSVVHVKFSPDGSKLLSYSSRNQDMAMWDVRKARLLWKRPISFIQKADEYYTLNVMAWSPDNKRIATGSGNGTIQLWDAQTGAFIWIADITKKDVSALVFSPDGKTIAALPYSGEPNAAKLVDVATGALVKTFSASQCIQVAVAFDPTGTGLKIANLDGNVGSWDLGSGKPLEEPGCRTMIAYGGERSFSEDLSLSVRRTTAEDVVIEESSGKAIRTNKLNDSRMISVINSKAKLAVIGEYGGYRLYNLSSGEDRILDDCVSGSAFDLSNNGDLFAQSCDGFKTAIKVTNLANGEVSLLDGHPSTIHAITYSPDYSLLAIAGNDGNAYFLDAETKAVQKVLEGNGSRLP